VFHSVKFTTIRIFVNIFLYYYFPNKKAPISGGSEVRVFFAPVRPLVVALYKNIAHMAQMIGKVK